MQVNGEEKINDATLPVMAHCLKDIDTGHPTNAELWPREKAGKGFGLGVLGLVDIKFAKSKPSGDSYQEATRDLLQLGTWVNQSMTANVLADKLEKYVGGFETYGEKEKTLSTSWFAPTTPDKAEVTPGRVSLVRFSD